jgi:hypothetical protein
MGVYVSPQGKGRSEKSFARSKTAELRFELIESAYGPLSTPKMIAHEKLTLPGFLNTSVLASFGINIINELSM